MLANCKVALHLGFPTLALVGIKLVGGCLLNRGYISKVLLLQAKQKTYAALVNSFH